MSLIQSGQRVSANEIKRLISEKKNLKETPAKSTVPTCTIAETRLTYAYKTAIKSLKEFLDCCHDADPSAVNNYKTEILKLLEVSQ